jgi:hypothetical protein
MWSNIRDEFDNRNENSFYSVKEDISFIQSEAEDERN